MCKNNNFTKMIFALLVLMVFTFTVYAEQEGKVVTEEGVFVDGEFIIDRASYLEALAEGELQFYTAHSLSQDEEMVKTFMKHFPAIKVEITRAGGATLH